MRSLILVFCFSFLGGNVVQACICMGEPLDSCLKNNNAIFIGVLTQIVQMDSLFMVHRGRNEYSTYFNFRVLKYYKGLERSSDYVSVFTTDGSCGGYCAGAIPGDTMLLFANYIGNPFSGMFISGSQCERARKLSETMPSIDSLRQVIRNGTDSYYLRYYRLVPFEEEVQFLQDSSVRWSIPYNKDAYFDELNQRKKPEEVPNKKTPLNWPLFASLLLNLLFAVLFWFRKIRQ